MCQPRAVRASGFTLVEMLIVFAVFGLIGVLASQIVTRVLSNYDLLSARGDRLAEVQRAVQIMQRDILQLSARGIRDQLGDPLQPVLIGADGLMEFTRGGWRNPLARNRSELQRVAYVTQNGDLYRAYWSVLDRDAVSEPLLQELLADVAEIEFFAVDVNGDEHSFWPVGAGGPGEPTLRLAAVLLRMELPPFGIVERIWPVPSV